MQTSTARLLRLAPRLRPSVVGLTQPRLTPITSSFYSTKPPPSPTASEEAVKADLGQSDILKKTVTQTTTVEVEEVDQHHHETRPHHPLKSDIEHLESPSHSEETVHADRLPEHADPLKGKAKKGGRGFHTSAISRGDEKPASSKADEAKGSPVHHEPSAAPTDSEESAHAEKHSEDPLGKLDGSGKKGSSAKSGGTGKRSFSTSVRSLLHDPTETSPQHVEKSGINHLDKSSLSEEVVHADKYAKDPLEGKKEKVGETVVQTEKGPVQPEDEVLKK